MPNSVIISDASTLIGLERIGRLAVLQQLYGLINITSIVQREVGIELPDWIQVNDGYQESIFRLLRQRLDDGEASAIALAAAIPDALLIIDERKGRQQAKEMGIRITGLLGIIIRAKREGAISEGKEALDHLMANGVRLSRKIYHLALDQMGERPSHS